MKVRTSKFIIIFLLCLMLCVSLFGCVRPIKTNDKIFDDGYFSFVKVYKNSKAIKYTGAGVDIDGNCSLMLLELTEEGKKQKVIDVPDTVNGLPVVSIDPYYWTEVGRIYERENNYGNFESECLEKMYINSSIKRIGCWPTRVITKNLCRLIINNQSSGVKIENLGCTADLIVVIHHGCSDEILHAMQVRFEVRKSQSRVFEANIEYKYNYDTGTAQENYRIDLIKDKTETPYEFVDPIREGYTFGGWYLETECVNEWDGSIESIIDEESGDIKFYSERNLEENQNNIEFGEDKYYINKTDKILRLYAKWIEN